MCGITGFIHSSMGDNDPASRLSPMLTAIHHRGPDDRGMWFDRQSGVALGHQRLSILDNSSMGHQPMVSHCGRFVIIFNGEIYNHLELRKKVEDSNPSIGWHGHSDTETLLACIAAWGVDDTLKSSVGMFALAVWDKNKKSLILARDRIGEKPLYYGWQNQIFFFGSELKSIRVHPDFIGEMDWRVANLFLRLNYIPSPSTIYKGIYKLTPGTWLELTHKDIQQKTISDAVSYWSLSESAINGLENPYKGNYTDAVDELEVLISQSVKLQSIADVPVGAFLSGGIDSSTVVAMMQATTSSQVTTFAIGMPDSKMDESKHAAAVAKHLGTEHIEHIIQPQEALDLIPYLSEIWDEPFADSSQIPTYLVSKLAKEKVTVALSGDGGDEIFLGYPQYSLYQKLWKTRCLGKLPWNTTFKMFSPFANNSLLKKSRTIVNAWRQPNTQFLNRFWMDNYRQSHVPLMNQQGISRLPLPILSDVASTAGLWDAGTYLPDDILVKVDIAAMANSLETRAPLLDHRIIEFAHRLPLEYKLVYGQNKRILRDVLYRHVPEKIVNRPKMGFSIPMGMWLKNDLHPWAEELITQAPNISNNFNKEMINLLWKEHLSGRREHTERLWGILMLLEFSQGK